MSDTMLHAQFQSAREARNHAADVLAYDIAFRNIDPFVGQHQEPSAELTERLIAQYRQAHEEARAAFVAWQGASS